MKRRQDRAALSDAYPALAALGLYFLRLGACGFGGPIALAARMQRDLVETREWCSPPEYLEGLAFSQLAPGPLAAQLAMYLGYLRRGVAGATVAGAAFVAPSFVIVVLFAAVYVHEGGAWWIQAAFRGIGPAVIGLIALAARRLMAKVVGRDRLLLAIFSVVAVWTVASQRELVALFIAAGATTLAARHISLLRRPATSRVPAAFLVHLPAGGPASTLLVFFFKAGLFVFGSGLAIVPFLYAGVVQDHRWLSDQQFVDAVAVAMMTPGPVVIAVVFIGYLVAGMEGACVSAVGIFAPVYLMVVACAPLFRRYAANRYLQSFVAGVTAATAGAIAGAVVVLGRRTIHDPMGIALAAATVPLVARWRLPEPAVVAGGALLGLCSYWL